MKISEFTLTALAALAKINPHIVIEPGIKLRSKNEAGTVFVQAETDTEFPVEFALHDLPNFLKVIGMFDDPDLDFQDNFVLISDESGAKQKYYYSEKEELIYADKDPKELPYNVGFDMSDELFKKALKACGVNGVEDVAFVGGNGGVWLKTLDKENPKREFSVKLNDTDTDEFTTYMKHGKKTKLNMLPLDYYVRITNVGAISFKSVLGEYPIEYIFATELDSEHSSLQSELVVE